MDGPFTVIGRAIGNVQQFFSNVGEGISDFKDKVGEVVTAPFRWVSDGFETAGRQIGEGVDQGRDYLDPEGSAGREADRKVLLGEEVAAAESTYNEAFSAAAAEIQEAKAAGAMPSEIEDLTADHEEKLAKLQEELNEDLRRGRTYN